MNKFGLTDKKNYENFNRWRLLNPNKHNKTGNEWNRIHRGYYDKIPAKIEKLIKDRRKMDRYYNKKISKLEKELSEYNQRQIEKANKVIKLLSNRQCNDC